MKTKALCAILMLTLLALLLSACGSGAPDESMAGGDPSETSKSANELIDMRRDALPLIQQEIVNNDKIDVQFYTVVLQEIAIRDEFLFEEVATMLLPLNNEAALEIKRRVSEPLCEYYLKNQGYGKETDFSLLGPSAWPILARHAEDPEESLDIKITCFRSLVKALPESFEHVKSALDKAYGLDEESTFTNMVNDLGNVKDAASQERLIPVLFSYLNSVKKSDTVLGALVRFNANPKMTPYVEDYINSEQMKQEFKDWSPSSGALREPLMLLTKDGSENAMGVLLRTVQKPDMPLECREYTLKTLAESWDASEVAQGLATVQDTCPEDIRMSVIYYICKSGGKVAIDTLTGYLASKDSGERAKAIVSLLNSKEEGFVIIQRILDTPTELQNFKDDYSCLILLGCNGSEPFLLKLLQEFGTKEMAERYLNSGNEALKTAGSAWATEHGYMSIPIADNNTSSWGNGY